MRKFLVIVPVIAMLAVGCNQRAQSTIPTSTQSKQQSADTIAALKWQTYIDPSSRYSVRYPTGFSLGSDGDGTVVRFVNTGIVKESQPAFFSIELQDNAKKLSLQDWWSTQDRAQAPGQGTVNLHAALGAVPAITVTPTDLGSTQYTFVAQDKIVTIRGFLVEPYIDAIVSSFELH